MTKKFKKSQRLVSERNQKFYEFNKTIMSFKSTAAGALVVVCLFFIKTCDNCAGRLDVLSKNFNEKAFAHGDKAIRRVDEMAKGIFKDAGANRSADKTTKSKYQVVQRSDDGTLKVLNEKETTIIGPIEEIRRGTRETLVVKGKLSDDEIRDLNRKGIKFICDKAVFDRQRSIKDFKIILLYSDRVETLRSLYSIDDKQANELLQLSSEIDKRSLITKVGTEEELNKTLKDFQTKNTKPIVVFPNIDNMLFGHSMDYYNLDNVITCNSYTIPTATFLKSTDFLDLRYVVKSINGTFGNCENLFEFYRNFSINYSTYIERSNSRRIAATVVLVGATGGGVTAIVHYNNNKG
jgi:hypothetical protein